MHVGSRSQVGEIHLDDLNFEKRPYDRNLAYTQSKLANVLHALDLSRRLDGTGVSAFSVHPGVIMTELGRHMSPQDWEDLQASVPEGQEMTLKSVEQGAATSVWAATSPDLEGRGGMYLEDCQIAGPGVPGGRGGVQAYAQDPDEARRLWTLSEELVGQAFDI